MSDPRNPESESRRAPVSALPSQAARALAFIAIVVGGLAGAVIGFGVAKVSCTGDCTAQKAGGSIIGALFIGIGIAIVAVLVLRAMGEWNAVKEREANVVLGSRTALRTPGRPQVRSQDRPSNRPVVGTAAPADQRSESTANPNPSEETDPQ